MNNSDIEILRVDLDRLGEWVVENAMNINPVASKVVSFTRGRVKDSLNYFLEGPKNSGSERLQIYKNNHTLDWSINYSVKNARKALHFITRILWNGNSNAKSLVYMSLVRPILEYGAACWDPCREGQINALDRVQKKRLNSRIIRVIGYGKAWYSVERYCALARPLQSLLRRKGLESCRGQVTRTMLPKQGWSWSEKLGQETKNRY